jgi:molecular chaperone HtpG
MFKAMNQAMPPSKRILELNPAHPLVDAMQQLFNREPENQQLKDYAGLLYDQALLTEGSPITDPLEFSKRIANLMVSNLGCAK